MPESVYEESEFDFGCDICLTEGEVISNESPSHGCRKCDYDVCSNCLYYDSLGDTKHFAAIIRHGQGEGGEGLDFADEEDGPLGEKGIEMAKATGKFLRE